MRDFLFILATFTGIASLGFLLGSLVPMFAVANDVYNKEVKADERSTFDTHSTYIYFVLMMAVPLWVLLAIISILLPVNLVGLKKVLPPFQKAFDASLCALKEDSKIQNSLKLFFVFVMVFGLAVYFMKYSQ